MSSSDNKDKTYTYEVTVTLKLDITSDDEDIAMDIATLDFKSLKEHMYKNGWGVDILDDDLYTNEN